MSTAVAVCFYEHLLLDPPVRRDVARWLSTEDFMGLKNVFHYHLNEQEWDRFAEEFTERKSSLARQTVRNRSTPQKGQGSG